MGQTPLLQEVPSLAQAVPASPARLRSDIIRLAWPVVAEQLLGTLAQTVDMVLVGPLGAVSVAAVGLSTQPLWFLMGPFYGLGSGLGALVSRFVGAGEHENARAASRQGFWLGTILSVLVGALIWWQATNIVIWMGGEPEAVPAAAAYLRALAPGLLALFWSMTMAAVPRAAGDTRTPFYISVGVNVLNFVLAWAMIYGHLGLPAMGLVGAGIATSTSRILGAVALWVVLVRGTGETRLEVNRLGQIDVGLIKRILNVGIPATVERLATSLAYVVYTRMVSSLGTVIQAAHYTAVIAEQISWTLGSGLTTAAATLVGQALGAKEPKQADAAIREAMKIGTVLVVPITILFLGFPTPYMHLFSKDPEVIAPAVAALRMATAGEWPMILSLVFIGALVGAGDSRAVAGVSLIGGWVVRLGLAALFVLVLPWGLTGAWAASVVDWFVRAALLFWRFRTGKWQSVKV